MKLFKVVNFRSSLRVSGSIVRPTPTPSSNVADAGLALMREGYVTVSRTVQEALAEWLDANAFQSG